MSTHGIFFLFQMSAIADWYESLRRLSIAVPKSLAENDSVAIDVDEESPEEFSEEEEEDSEKKWIVDDVELHLKRWIQRLESEPNPFLSSSKVFSKGPVLPDSQPADPYDGQDWTKLESYEWDGNRDRNGNISGSGTLFLSGGTEQISGTFRKVRRNGHCKVITPELELSGNFSDDRLEGYGSLVLSPPCAKWSSLLDDESKIRIDSYFKKSVLHGLARILADDSRRLAFVGRFENGKPSGEKCWRFYKGGGCLFADVDSKGRMSSDDAVYVYPDWKTCYSGKFENGVMIKAVAARISAFRNVQGIADIKVETVSDEEFRFEPEFCPRPLQPDPYEAQCVVCRPSNIPEGGDGVFLKLDVEAGVVVAFYNGVKLKTDLRDPETDEWKDCAYRLYVDPDEFVDLPQEMATDLSKYSASLGHKINHSFGQSNCSFETYRHPRFGRIPCVVTTMPVKSGQELLACYNYLLTDCPEWYSKLWETNRS